jgi:hypothetical protein
MQYLNIKIRLRFGKDGKEVAVKEERKRRTPAQENRG